MVHQNYPVDPGPDATDWNGLFFSQRFVSLIVSPLPPLFAPQQSTVNAEWEGKKMYSAHRMKRPEFLRDTRFLFFKPASLNCSRPSHNPKKQNCQGRRMTTIMSRSIVYYCPYIRFSLQSIVARPASSFGVMTTRHATGPGCI